MSVDVRTREDGLAPSIDAALFFRETLPEALDAQREAIAPGAAGLRLRPLTIETPDATATVSWRGGRGDVTPGPIAGDSVVWRLSAQVFGDFVCDQTTPMAMFSSGTLAVEGGGLGDLLDWWLVLRAALDGRAIHTPGSVGFRGRDGSPLDLRRAFAPDDDPADMTHFLHEAGFLHLRGWLEPERMDEISADMDAAAGDYSDGDGQSWWVTTRDGARRVVRMQSFDAKSRATVELLEDPGFLRIGALTGDGHRHQGLVGNRVEALFKPIGVAKGISDVPWHKDCSLGRHSYDCSNLTTGISVTGAADDSGQLRVRPGSHRALCWPALAQPGLDLPDLPLPTEKGDLTVHLSCTLHMAQPPAARERCVLYTSFRLPDRSDAAALARQKIRAVREKSAVTVSQEPSSAG
jgi:Phytanoyl-CoA dioxygenase (PhyH)